MFRGERVLVNKPTVSRAIVGFYVAIALLIAVLTAFFIYTGIVGNVVTAVIGLAGCVLVEALILMILYSIYGTKYVLEGDELAIEVTRLVKISRRKAIRLSEIKSIERTLIPFGFRLLGASFYGGYFYIPGLGRAFMAITNFKDGVLIKTERGNYVITPRDPDRFIELLKKFVLKQRP